MIQEPTQPTLTPTPTRARPNTALRIAIVIVASLALAIPIIVAMAVSPGPTATILAGASADPEASSRPASSEHPGKGQGRSDGHGPGRGPITIKAITGSQLSLATEDGWSRTVTVGPGTTITRGGVAIALGDLKVGDEVGFRQTRNADGTYTITAITVATARAGGEVSAIDGNAITVKKKDGTTRVITVTSATIYKLGPNPGTKADVKVGTMVDAAGLVSGDTFTAITVRIRLAMAGGEVTAKTSDSITVKDRTGTTRVIHVTGSTTYEVRGKPSGASLADIAMGDRVIAAGTLRADGALDAVNVHGGPPKGSKPDKAPVASTTPG